MFYAQSTIMVISLIRMRKSQCWVRKKVTKKVMLIAIENGLGTVTVWLCQGVGCEMHFVVWTSFLLLQHSVGRFRLIRDRK